MSPFLDSIATIVGVFQQHARGDGDGSGLSRGRMRELIQREFTDSLVKAHDPQTIEKILQFLEWDGDGDIDFNEFLLLVFRVAKCCFWFQPRPPRDREGLREEEPADVRKGRQRQEPQPRADRWSRREPGCDERAQRARGGDGGGDYRPRESELLQEERSRHRRCELEQRELEGRSSRVVEQECPESRRPHQSYLDEPLEIDLEECGRAEAEERGYRRRRERERELESAKREREIREELEREERDDPRRKGRERERRVDRERDLEVSERRRREREEEVAAIAQRETRERRERDIREIEGDVRREQEVYERRREISVAAAEADVKVRREIRERGEELRRRECPRECEEEVEPERRICPRREREE
ncbi:TRHY protein, partial [Chloropsis hardwickii]|nr:TRHY protein [Chloropsis hardwickii]